jgi:wobble nucleotide-excising tRNase
MIECLHLLRGIGKFDDATAANITLNRYTLVYAENGRGKTTLTAVLRSLATGDAVHILERRRLTTRHVPHAVLNCTGGPPDAVFQNGAWNRTLPDIAIFDDRFVDENVHSGLAVESEHRQNLHELILGAAGVALNRELQDAVAQITADNALIKRRGDAISQDVRHGIAVEQFCTLPVVPNIDAQIVTAEQSVRSARQATEIQRAVEFAGLTLPTFDADALNAMLPRVYDARPTRG